MKKNRLWVGVAAIAAAFSACSQEENMLKDMPGDAKQTYSFQALFSPETRTTFNADFSGLEWTEGDVIGFYTDANDQNIQSTPVEDGYFSADLSEGATEVYAYYPYSENASYGTSDLVLPVNPIQRQLQAGMLNGTNLTMLAHAQLSAQGTTKLVFTPRCSVIAFNVYNPDDMSERVESISFTATGHMTSGDCTINWNTGEPGNLDYYRRMSTVSLAYDCTLNASKPVDKSNYIYLAVASEEYAEGGTVTVTTNKMVYYFDYTTQLDLSNVYSIQTLSLNLQNATSKEPVAYYDSEAFPDATFRQYVFAQFDANQDGKLSTGELGTAENIQCDNVSTFKGIELFKNLRFLGSSKSPLTETDLTANTKLEEVAIVGQSDNISLLKGLNLSKNTELTFLSLDGFLLDELDISHNTKLATLYCGQSQLKELNLTQNSQLKVVSIWESKLTSLDVSQNTELTILQLPQNQLASIDVSHNTKLTQLMLNDNQLEELNVANCTALENLSCYGNKLTGLDVTHNPKLTFLSCRVNRLTELDLSENSQLSTLECGMNCLASLDVSRCAQYMAFLVCYPMYESVTENGTYLNERNYFSFTQAEDQTFAEGFFYLPSGAEITKVKVDR